MDTDRKLMLAAVLSFLFTQAVYSAPFNGDSDGSTRKTPTISNVVNTSSSSTIVAKWVTSDDASSYLACGTRQGLYIHASVDRNNVSAKTHENVVAGLLPSTVYHCRVTAANGNGATRATFSLSTMAEALLLGRPQDMTSSTPRIRCLEIRFTTAGLMMGSRT